MSVTNYTPDQCRYLLSKLENIVYLVSEDALKDIKIDNGSAYVTSINESPLSIKCYNLKLTEDETLDERYKFAHTVTFSVNGYMNKDNFNDRYYVILKDKEGTYWLVNPLFPSKVTYTYTLGDMQNHTDFTLATVSNHPVLRLNEFTVSDSNECESYWLDGIEELRLNEKKYSAHIDNHIKYTNPGGFSDIHFNEKSCTITETFDGEKVSHQIDFNILLSQYKNDWHYSLLEFTDNIYAAVFKTLNGKYGLCGFSMGLQPSFTINGESQTTNNYIKISLVDAHTDGLTLDFFDEVDYEYLSSTTWVYTADFGGYECVGEGEAMYLLKKEIDALENETGNYMVLDGYESYFQESSWPVFHIAGTFNTRETFDNMSCMGSDCSVNTSLPSQIEFNTVATQYYSFESDSPWIIASSKAHITVSPSSGRGHTPYNLAISNSMTPTNTAETSTLTIEYCNTSSTVNVIVNENSCLSEGSTYNINAEGQTLSIPSECCIDSVVEATSILTDITVYTDHFSVTVPKNETGDLRVITLNITFCNGTYAVVTINQGETLDRWHLVDGFVCDECTAAKCIIHYNSGNSALTYSVTGTGEVIRSEVVSYRTSATDVVLTPDANSIGDNTFSGFTSLQFARIPGTVQNIGTSAFMNCQSMTECPIPYGVNTIGNYAFRNCASLFNADIPGSVTSIGSGVFRDCLNFQTVSIPSSLTTIPEECFYNCDGLSDVEIPASITSIGNSAFSGCNGLYIVTVMSETPPTLGTNVFAGTNSEIKFYVPSNSVNDYKSSPGWSTYGNKIYPM